MPETDLCDISTCTTYEPEWSYESSDRVFLRQLRENARKKLMDLADDRPDNLAVLATRGAVIALKWTIDEIDGYLRRI